MALRLLGPLLAAITLVSCNPAVPTLHLPKGRVTFEGKPVAYGTIEFIPNAAAGNHGPAANVEVIDGSYDMYPDGGKGLSKGSYVARVTIFSRRPPAPRGEEERDRMRSVICVGFPIDVDIAGRELNIAVPESAKGFDMYKEGRPPR